MIRYVFIRFLTGEVLRQKSSLLIVLSSVGVREVLVALRFDHVPRFYLYKEIVQQTN